MIRQTEEIQNTQNNHINSSSNQESQLEKDDEDSSHHKLYSEDSQDLDYSCSLIINKDDNKIRPSLFPRTKINNNEGILRTNSLKKYTDKKFLSTRQKELFDKPVHLIKSQMNQDDI